MPWSTGSDVVVRVLGNKRGVVIAPGRKGQYRVRVDGVTVSCREEDLAVPPRGSKKERADQRRRSISAATPPDDATAPGRVDLHGLRVEEAMVRVVDEIDRALLRGADRVEIVHGKGTGRIRDALHRHLNSMPVVASFKRDPRNPGVTWVYF